MTPILAPSLFFLCVSLFLGGIPFLLTGAYDSKRLFQVLILALLGLSTFFPSHRRELGSTWNGLPRHARVALGLFFLLGLVSSLQAPLPKVGVQETALMFLLCILSLVFAGWVRRERGTNGLTAWTFLLAMGASIYGFAFLVKALIQLMESGVLTRDVFIHFSNPRFLNQYQTLLIPLLGLPLLLHPQMRLDAKQIVWIAGISWWLILFASGAKGSFVALGCAALGIYLLFGQTAKPWFRFQILALAPASVLYGVKSLVGPASASTRTNLWSLALEMTTDNPLFGVGPQHFALHPNGLGAHPHNGPLQIIAEWGQPAGLLLGGLLLWGLIAWVGESRRYATEKGVNDPETQTRIAVTASLLAGGVHAQVSGLLVMPLAQTALALIIGLALGLYQGKKTANDASSPLPALAAGVAACALLWSLFPEVLMLKELEAAYREAPQIAHNFFPRFWKQGFLSP